CGLYLLHKDPGRTVCLRKGRRHYEKTDRGWEIPLPILLARSRDAAQSFCRAGQVVSGREGAQAFCLPRSPRLESTKAKQRLPKRSALWHSPCLATPPVL